MRRSRTSILLPVLYVSGSRILRMYHLPPASVYLFICLYTYYSVNSHDYVFTFSLISQFLITRLTKSVNTPFRTDYCELVYTTTLSLCKFKNVLSVRSDSIVVCVSGTLLSYKPYKLLVESPRTSWCRVWVSLR